MTQPKTRTLADFLLARIVDDEAVANVASLLTSDWNAYLDGYLHDKGVVRHAQRHDPARVLAECEAKRQIIDRTDGHTNNWMSDLDNDPESRVYGRYCLLDDEVWPCSTIRLLALPYADHPDFRQEWRPDTPSA